MPRVDKTFFAALTALRRQLWAPGLILVLAITAARDARLLFHHDIPVGVDGYYYVIQVRHLVDDGQLYFPTRSRGFLYIAAGMSRVFGSSISCIKILSLSLHSLLLLGVFLFLCSITGSRWLGLLGSTLAALSALHLYFIAEFNSNLCAVTFLIWSLVFAAYGWTGSSKARWMHYTACLILLAVAGASHLSAIPLASVLVACTIMAGAMLEGGRRAQVGLILLTIAWFMPAWLARLAPQALPSWAENSFQSHASWPIVDAGGPEKLFLLFAAPLLLTLIVTNVQRLSRDALLIVGTGAIFSLLILLNPFLNFRGITTTLPGRLSLLSYLIVALLAPCLIWMLQQIAPKWTPLALFLVFGVGVTSTRSAHPSGLGDDYLVRCERLMVGLRTHLGDISQDSLILARPGEDFVVTATLGLPSQWQIPLNVKPKQTAWLIDRMPFNLLTSSMRVVLLERDSATVLLANQDLVGLLKTSNTKDLDKLEIDNPHLYSATHPGSRQDLTPFKD